MPIFMLGLKGRNKVDPLLGRDIDSATVGFRDKAYTTGYWVCLQLSSSDIQVVQVLLSCLVIGRKIYAFGR